MHRAVDGVEDLQPVVAGDAIGVSRTGHRAMWQQPVDDRADRVPRSVVVVEGDVVDGRDFRDDVRAGADLPVGERFDVGALELDADAVGVVASRVIGELGGPVELAPVAVLLADQEVEPDTGAVRSTVLADRVVAAP